MEPVASKDSECEIVVKGLPPNAKEFELARVFGETAPVLDVRLVSRPSDLRIDGPLKSAYLRFAKREYAEDAARRCKSFNEYPVTAEVVEQFNPLQPPRSTPLLKVPIQAPAHPDHWLAVLLNKIKDHPDPKGLVASSMQGWMETTAGLNFGREVSDDEDDSEMHSEAVLKPEMRTYLERYPNCKKLMVKIRSIPNNDNKTPVSVLNEYAKRTGLNLEYEMSHDLNVGPYHVECRLTSMDRASLYAVGEGDASTKKEARHVASAAAIDVLLDTVKEAAFMAPGRAKVQRD